MWWERLHEFEVVQREVSGRLLSFYVEKTRTGFVHACTVEDVCHFLTLLPLPDWDGIFSFVFRQPSSKQLLLKADWGRIAYWAELFSPGEPPCPAGPAIFLDAVDVNRPLKWSKKLGPDDQAELLRLSRDGHDIKIGRKSIFVRSTYSSVRDTQLYRTLPHEIGHWVDYRSRVEVPSSTESPDRSELWEHYWSRPEKERETFAHRYANRVVERLSESNAVPFDQISAHREFSSITS